MRSLLLALLLSSCAARVREPGLLPSPPLSGAPSEALRVCWVEFATGVLPHKLVVARGGLAEDVVSTQSGLLLVHPEGSWLIDGGMASDLEAQLDLVHGLPRVFLGQAAKDWARVASPADAVRAAGVDPSALAGGIPTHGHFDHLGGLLEIPGLPIVLPQGEIDLAQQTVDDGGASILPGEARALLTRAKALAWEDGPFLYWDRSLDLFGDGSVVLVPLPGHTPGSLGVHLRLPDGRAAFLVGDTVWVREGYEQREPKSWLAGSFDADEELNGRQIGLLWALHRAQPELTILPAHDRRQWEALFGAPGCVGG